MIVGGMTAELAMTIGAISRRTGIHPADVMPLALRDLEGLADLYQKAREVRAFWVEAEMLAGRTFTLDAIDDALPFIAVLRLAEHAGIGAVIH
ncbi:MAG: hypothetical protein AAGG47_13005 [Pseudomonadota bacterium]